MKPSSEPVLRYGIHNLGVPLRASPSDDSILKSSTPVWETHPYGAVVAIGGCAAKEHAGEVPAANPGTEKLHTLYKFGGSPTL